MNRPAEHKSSQKRKRKKNVSVLSSCRNHNRYFDRIIIIFNLSICAEKVNDKTRDDTPDRGMTAVHLKFHFHLINIFYQFFVRSKHVSYAGWL